MPLETYRQKRNFDRTPEPKGEAGPRRKAGLFFCIQQHAARRLHYDFRLELDGVLKSWAVPKGPSLDPHDKRLAVHVEDHPMGYGEFEGTIPAGEYGGGTVMLWDKGTWEPLGDDPRRAYEEGSLKLALHGTKLHGAWALVRMGGKSKQERADNWLLIKEHDDQERPGEGDFAVRTLTRSVKTGRDMAAIAAGDPPVEAQSGEPLPAKLSPQLATLVDKVPETTDWLHEIKYDGYRLIACKDAGNVTLITRGGLDWTAKFPAIERSVAALPAHRLAIDGEVVALLASGVSSFGGLQQALSSGRTDALVYFVFDLLHIDGEDVRGQPLIERKQRLERLLGTERTDVLRFSDHVVGRGVEFHRQACAAGLEGTVAKGRDAPYAGGRSANWLKIKCGQRQEFIVIGFVPSGRRQGFRSLVLGYYDAAGTLRYAGRCGTGFDNHDLETIRARLDPLVIEARPVASVPPDAAVKEVRWVRPELVAEIAFAGWTDDGVLRHAAFQGLRDDKPASEVVLEMPDDPAPSAAPAPGHDTIAGVTLSHPEKVLYPEQGITKRDLAHYYEAVADWALPHLGGRPLSLVRCPEGEGKVCFFQKHVGSGVPSVINRVEITEADGSKEIYLAVHDLAGLVALVQMGVLEIHPWGCRIGRIEQPDWVVLDLDPDEGLPWSRVRQAALELKSVLDGVGLTSFLKTTGGKGLHVCVPLRPRRDWDSVKAFTKSIADFMVAAAPDRYVSVMSKKKREGKVFVDYLRNGRGQTSIGAYSARARTGAPVSAPISWTEVEASNERLVWTVATMPARLKQLAADPWAGIFDVKQSITVAMERKLQLKR